MGIEDLTESQRAAVDHWEGPLMVLAGPGSGKTLVTTHRIVHLIQRGVSPDAVVAMTFTNKAAREMADRVAALLPGARPWIGTIHGFCARLLRQYAGYVGLQPNFTIYDTDDSRKVLQQVIKSLELDLTFTGPARLAGRISRLKGRLVLPGEFCRKAGAGQDDAILQEIYPAYQARLVECNAVDFDDLLVYVARLLAENPELRRSLDRGFRHVLVDEYQDTNYVQYQILRGLAVDYPNLTVTGDPDQAIYGWRGASLSNILDFEVDYPDVQVVRLEQNYRSTPEILRVADHLIQFNTRRKHKALFTERPSGAAVRLVEYASHSDEAEMIVEDIVRQIEQEGRNARDFAIVYRTNWLSRAFEEQLRRHGISFQIVQGFEFYQRAEVKDVLAYLRLINNPRDDVAVRRIINVPSRRLGNVTVERLAAFAAREQLSLLDAAARATQISGLAKATEKRLLQFAQLIHELSSRSDRPVRDLLETVLERTGYLKQFSNPDDLEDRERLANVNELITAAAEFDDTYEGNVSPLERFLEQTALVNDVDSMQEGANKVNLMTLHAVKGLEFPVVYVVGVEEGLLPHERNRDDPEQFEEERRLLFVGITRAKDRLSISYARSRSIRGNFRLTAGSCFLSELPRGEMEFRRGSDGFGMPDYEIDQDHLDCWSEPSFDVGAGQKKPQRDRRQAADRIESGGRPSGPPPGTPQGATCPDRAAHWTGSGPKSSDDARLAQFVVGVPVDHPRYGKGVVVDVSGRGTQRTATVDFGEAGERRIVLAYSDMQIVGA